MLSVESLARTLMLGTALDALRTELGPYELLAHWKQGEFHHDVVLRVPATPALPGRVLIIATNCNGGIKEVLCFDEQPERYALWHWRCPNVADFSGEIPALLARATTEHYFDPCEILADNARSELRPEFRQRQVGGGWQMTGGSCGRVKAE